MQVKKNCAIHGCTQEARARGWCMKHYKLWWRNGDPNTVHARPASTFREIHRQKFSQRHWNRWWRETFNHPHQRYLEEGIREFRSALNLGA